MTKTSYREIEPYTTKDGSIIRELMHPDVHENIAQSLAEAVIMPGDVTFLYVHVKSEEIYHIIQGSGMMRLEDESFRVKAGDTVCILPGKRHQVHNTGKIPLKILCCCSPAYSHDDTIVIEE